VPGVQVLGIDRGDAIGVRIQLRFHGNGPKDFECWRTRSAWRRMYTS
jgi:hypothetical protein